MRVLLIVDIQNDFLPGGALPVARGNEVIPIANSLMPYFETIIATQDWHPANHGSFAANNPGKKPGDMHELGEIPQIMWPVHCVEGTAGAEFPKTLDTSKFTRVVRKGTDHEIDSYSAFYDNARRKDTGMAKILRDLGVTDVYVMGLATDYCVKYTVLDAVSLGFKTYVVVDGIQGVNLSARDSDNALTAMRKAGATLIGSSTITQ